MYLKEEYKISQTPNQKLYKKQLQNFIIIIWTGKIFLKVKILTGVLILVEADTGSREMSLNTLIYLKYLFYRSPDAARHSIGETKFFKKWRSSSS